MSKERSQLKPQPAHYPQFFLPSARPSRFGPDWAHGCESMPTTLPPGARSRNPDSQRGFLLVLLLPLLLLLSAFLMGTLKVTASAQAIEALHARLDVCAVRLAVSRERVLSKLTKTNNALQATVNGIYLARALMVTGPAGAAAAESEEVLLESNHSLATLQDSLITQAMLLESSGMRCADSANSAEPASCYVNPAIGAAFNRATTLFPDVKGALRHRTQVNSNLAKIRCRGIRNIETELIVQGDSALTLDGYADIYRK